MILALADTGAVLVVSAVVTIALVAQLGRWGLARVRRARRRGHLRDRAADVASRAETLTEVVVSLTMRPNNTMIARRVHHECRVLLGAADAIEHEAVGFGLRRAVKDVRESLLLLDADVSRAEALFVPSDVACDSRKHRFAMRRIAEWSDEVLLAARLLVIVAELEPE